MNFTCLTIDPGVVLSAKADVDISVRLTGGSVLTGIIKAGINLRQLILDTSFVLF